MQLSRKLQLLGKKCERLGDVFWKKRQEKKTKSMDPIFFAFYIADDLISWNGPV